MAVPGQPCGSFQSNRTNWRFFFKLEFAVVDSNIYVRGWTMIDKIGNINKIYQQQKNEPLKKAAKPGLGSDSVSISPEAHKAAEIAGHVKTVKTSVDDARVEKIKDVKEKLKNGDYDNLTPEMLDKIADRIAPALLGNLEQ